MTIRLKLDHIAVLLALMFGCFFSQVTALASDESEAGPIDQQALAKLIGQIVAAGSSPETVLGQYGEVESSEATETHDNWSSDGSSVTVTTTEKRLNTKAFSIIHKTRRQSGRNAGLIVFSLKLTRHKHDVFFDSEEDAAKWLTYYFSELERDDYRVKGSNFDDNRLFAFECQMYRTKIQSIEVNWTKTTQKLCRFPK